ncbi:hypothetical protein INS49_001516 [Diaporthe citri]|uniref:uncharacterized protein n=1 Tax=Diaporthe citri TaxID=83186 RepID=UPI001C8214A3|nr:uncharacterized protein INS49_001516 [Diaporthe citri]KAG6367329.1 hypothetical protein INS49_001516 [Diaporthe citri]
MSARYVSSKLIKNISKSGRTLAVEYVDKTTAWTRPSEFPASSIKQDFTDVVQENIDNFGTETTRVAMKESEHQSEKDKRVHYTAYALDKDGNVVETKHLVRHTGK